MKLEVPDQKSVGNTQISCLQNLQSKPCIFESQMSALRHTQSPHPPAFGFQDIFQHRHI